MINYARLVSGEQNVFTEGLRKSMAAELLLVYIPSRVTSSRRSTVERIWGPLPHDGSKMVSHFPPLVEGKKGPTFIQPPLPLEHLFISLLCRCSLGVMSDEHNEPLHSRLPLHRLLRLGHDLWLSLCRLQTLSRCYTVLINNRPN